MSDALERGLVHDVAKFLFLLVDARGKLPTEPEIAEWFIEAKELIDIVRAPRSVGQEWP